MTARRYGDMVLEVNGVSLDVAEYSLESLPLDEASVEFGSVEPTKLEFSFAVKGAHGYQSFIVAMNKSAGRAQAIQRLWRRVEVLDDLAAYCTSGLGAIYRWEAALCRSRARRLVS